VLVLSAHGIALNLAHSGTYAWIGYIAGLAWLTVRLAP
jgi:hypothetical protein